MKPRHGVLVLLATLSLITYLDRICISVAGPRMQDDLNISPEAWGWVVGVFALAYGAFEIPSGLMGDRFGPRGVLTRIVLWWSAFTALTGMVSNYYWLLAVRFCFGAGEAGAYPNASAAISRWFPERERGRVFGIVWMASQAGGALTPLLVVPIQQRYGWRASFYVFGLVGVLWSAAWYAWYRDNPAVPAVRHNFPWKTAARSANLWAVMLVALTYCYAMYFFIGWFHTYLVKGRGFTEPELAFSALPFLLGAAANALGGVASDILVRKLGLKWGRRTTGVAGLGVAAASMTGALLVAGKPAVLTLLAISYAAIAFQQPAVWAVCVDIGRRHAGAVSGAMNTAAQLGSFLLSISFGYLVSSLGSYNRPLVVIVAALLAAVVFWLRLDPTRELP